MSDSLTTRQLLSQTNEFIPSLYDLSLVINPLKPTFNGELSIDLVKNQNLISTGEDSGFKVVLNSSKLVFTKALLKFNETEEKLKIVYNKDQEKVSFFTGVKPVLSGLFNLQLTFVGQVNTIKTYSDPTFGLFKTNYLDPIGGKSSNYVIATHNQPCFTRRIFPLIDEIGFKIPIKLQVTTLNKFKVVSTSSLEEKEPISMTDDAIFKFKTTPPMSAHLFVIVLGDLECRESSLESAIPIKVYTPIGETSKSAYPLEVASKLLPFISEKILQVEYPLEKLDFVALPFLSDMVMENWGMITFHLEQVLHNSSEQQIRQLIAHELVHQWVGNFVSFDNWKWMWLNESFATWLGNYILSEICLDQVDKDLFLVNSTNEKHQLMSVEDMGNEVSIASFVDGVSKQTLSTSLNTGLLFNKEVYDKGICLLNMIANVLGNQDYLVMLRGVKKFIDDNKYTAVSADLLWDALNEQTELDLILVIQSYLESKGYPVVYVGIEDDKVIAKIDDGSKNIPLFVRSSADEVTPLVTKGPYTELSIKSKDFITLSFVGYYQVKYSLQLLPLMKAHFSQMSSSDLITIFTDYGKYLSLSVNTESDDLIVFISLVNLLSLDNWEVDYNVLKVALSHLESINNILAHNSEYTEFAKWLDGFTTRLFNKIGGWDLALTKESIYSNVEMSVRNSLLLLNLSNEQFQAVGKKNFKNLMNSGLNKIFTPKELIPSIFNLMIVQANQKEYKQILNFVKNSNVSVLDNTDCTIEVFQTCAVTSLGFTNNPDLLNKTLNFVLMNIDSKLIELGLIGFHYKPTKEMKVKLFQWYAVNYNTLVLRSLTKNSSWGVQLQSTLENISKIILGDLMVFDKELLKMKSDFVEKATKQLPAHGLVDILNYHQNEIDYKNIIGSYYEDLISYIK